MTPRPARECRAGGFRRGGRQSADADVHAGFRVRRAAEIIRLHGVGQLAAIAGADSVGRLQRLHRAGESDRQRDLGRHRCTGGAQTINTGLTTVQSSGRPVILRWQLVSGDPTYLAINNVHFVQGPAKQAPVLAWTTAGCDRCGTALSGAQLMRLRMCRARLFTRPRGNGAARRHSHADGGFHSHRHGHIRERPDHDDAAGQVETTCRCISLRPPRRLGPPIRSRSRCSMPRAMCVELSPCRRPRARCCRSARTTSR